MILQVFCSTKTDKESKVRTVTKAEVVEKDGELVFTFEGNGFLYNMIRILVGTSLQIGDGLRPISDMKEILEARDRQKAAQPLLLKACIWMKFSMKKRNNAVL